MINKMKNLFNNKKVFKLFSQILVDDFRIENVSTQTSNKSINKFFIPEIRKSIPCMNLKKFIINEKINYIDWKYYINDFEKKIQSALNIYENEISLQSKQFNKNKKLQVEPINNFVFFI